MTPAEKYAAELLSYLMQIVVGKAGDPSTREAWRTKALSARLDYGEVGRIMRDPQRKVSELMVYDAGILGLSKVLFHYNERLNFFKGEAFQPSLYPSEELLAVRLFMVQKIDRNEKVRLGALMARRDLLQDPLSVASPADLAAVNLRDEELELLRDVIHAEPFFMGYLEDPFLVDAMYRIGLVAMDAYVRSKTLEAGYGFLAQQYPRRKPSGNVLSVSILPSMVTTFDAAGKGAPGFPLGFRATDEYTHAVRELKRKLAAAFNRRVRKGMPGTAGHSAPGPSGGDAAEDGLNAHLRFISLDKRPLVVYPDNADKVIATLCPDADFNFILLGKNVYLSVPVDDRRDALPAVGRLYLDIADVARSDADYDIDQAAEFLFNRLKPMPAGLPAPATTLEQQAMVRIDAHE